MQFSQIWGEVASNFPTANQARCKLAVIAAYHEWLAARQWSYRESSSSTLALTASQAAYTLLGTSPIVPDFDGLIDVVLEMSTGVDLKKLTEMYQSDFDQVFGHVTTAGEPAVYCVRGGTPAANAAAVTQGGQQQLVLGPPPLATAAHGQKLTLRYFRSVGTMELSADSDVPLIPAQYHYALITGGNAYMAEAIGSQQKFMQFRPMFEKRISEAISTDMGLRGKDRQLLVMQSGASVYPITGQTPATLDLATRPYDRAS